MMQRDNGAVMMMWRTDRTVEQRESGDDESEWGVGAGADTACGSVYLMRIYRVAVCDMPVSAAYPSS